MPRPLWKGTISFGLVSVPVEMWSALRDRSIRFREIHVKDGSPVRHVRYCAEEGKKVDPSEIGRAYQIEDGRLIRITDEELEELEPEKTNTIEIESFTPRAEVDPVRFDHPYYLIPGDQTVGTVRAYRLLVEAMGEGDLLALGRFVMRNREYLAAIRVRGPALALSTMHFPAEIRSLDDVPGPEEQPEREAVENAIAVIGERTKKWRPSSFHDEHRARLEKVIASKRRGAKVKAPATKDEDAPTAAPDLMAALKKTLEQSRGRRRRPRDLSGLSKDQLYEMATERGLKGRSSMNKSQLLRALRK
ncbi:MAG: Ku protein [Solirubrobacterales bacterium]|nr:Ku protein [Solirubrobacterales bacterium]